MIRLFAIIVLAAPLLASVCQCELQDDNAHDYNQQLLNLITPEQRAEVESFLDFVDQTPKVNVLDGRYKQALIAYRQSKGVEATKTVEQRNNLFDHLEDSCQAVIDGLEALDIAHRVYGDDDDAKEADKPEQLVKLGRARWACMQFLRRFSRQAVQRELRRHDIRDNLHPHYRLDNFNAVRGLVEAPRQVADHQKGSRLGRLFRGKI